MRYEIESFKHELSLRESGNRHGQLNVLGFAGRYQLGQARLDDFNRVFETAYTTSDLLASPELQERVQDWHIIDIDSYIDKTGLSDFIGRTFHGVALSRGSLRAVAHLGGKRGLRKYLQSNGTYDPADANGTRLSDYAIAFANVTDAPAKPTRPHASVPTLESNTKTRADRAEFDRSMLIFPKEAVDWARRDNTLGRNLPIGEASGLNLRVGSQRSAESLSQILAWLNVENSERYMADGKDTFCNVYASDFCYLAGAYLPRTWGMGKPAKSLDWIHETPKSVEMTANALFDWLHAYGDYFGWKKISDLNALQEAANDGQCSLIIAKSIPNRHGHISIVCPETKGMAARREDGRLTEPLQSQTRLANGEVSARFDWWDQPQFQDFAFWVNDRRDWRCERLRPNKLIALLSKFVIAEDLDALDAKLSIYRDEVARLPDLPDEVFAALTASEDKRFFRHPGFDLIAIMRAVYRFCTRRKIEGASTIEQQLVRTITGHNERSYRRKINEIILALWCSSALDKKTIATIYLHNAYFGWRATGFQNALKRPEFLGATNAETAANLAASLRYPIARTESDKRRRDRERRVAFILKRMARSNRASVSAASWSNRELS
ncbi:MAG: biosynthetic peptidoglycan transglycosylase [Pseudomonadota bacterium]